MNKLQHVLVLLVALSVAGCASVYEKKAEADHNEVLERSNKANAQLRANQDKPQLVVLDNVPRFTRQSIPFQNTQLLPAHIGRVTLRMPGRQNLPTIANLIERLTGIPVTVAADALLPLSQFAPQAESATAPGGPAAAPAVPTTKTRSEAAKLQAAAQGIQKAGGPKQWVDIDENEPGLELNYQGSLAGLLDLVATHNDLQWLYANGKIHLYRVVTRTLLVKTLPAGSAEASAGGKEEGGGDDVLTGVEKTMRGMLSRHGRLQLDASLGSITVSDSFTNVQAMERHLDSINRQLSRQVALTVEVLQITLSNENQSGIDWNFVTNTVKLGTLSFNGPGGLPTGPGNISLVKTGDSGNNTLLLRALEKFGRVSTSYSSVITTMNRQAVPLGSVSTQSYLKQSTPAITASASGVPVVGQSGLTPGEFTTGFTLNLLPIVLDSNHVLLKAGITLSTLKELATFTSGEGSAKQSIQQPNISQFTTQQKMMVKSGDTIVLSGFENETTESRQSDLVRKTVPGTKDSNRNKSTLVVLITPRLLN